MSAAVAVRVAGFSLDCTRRAGDAGTQHPAFPQTSKALDRLLTSQPLRNSTRLLYMHRPEFIVMPSGKNGGNCGHSVLPGSRRYDSYLLKKLLIRQIKKSEFRGAV